MQWNLFNWKTITLILALLVPSWAQTTAPVQVTVGDKGDHLQIRMETQASQPALRMNPDPAFLELTFPNSKLAKGAFSKAIDKGLIRKVEVSESDSSVRARVYVLSKPKATLTKISGGFSYTISYNEMAGTPNRTAAPTKQASNPASAVKPKPQTPPQKPKAEPQKPAEKPAQPPKEPAATTPAPATPPSAPAATQPPATPPSAPAATQPPATPPSTPAATQPPATPPSAPAATQPSSPPPTANTATKKMIREYYPFKSRSAEKAMQAAQLAFPNATYLVDPILNILMVEGTAEEIQELETFLRAQSPK